jgi:hypothetical protein
VSTATSVRTPEVEGVNVVLLGSFNPRIFDPWWFAKEGLIQDDEAKNAEITVMTSNVAVFSLG